ncbi:MAG: chemotaxis protein CheX [Coriobacteriia bacterium]|nr:chemotaxis protein CheX [Coriobacteriia bacterium]
MITQEDLAATFFDVLHEVAKTMSGLTIKLIPQGEPDASGDICSVMMLDGCVNGVFSLSGSPQTFRMLCSGMIGASPKEVKEEDVADTLCELVNMTAGGVKLRLSETDFQFALAPPCMISLAELDVLTSAKERVITQVMGTDDLAVRLKVAY